MKWRFPHVTDCINVGAMLYQQQRTFCIAAPNQDVKLWPLDQY
jgi:hypothetical protein